MITNLQTEGAKFIVGSCCLVSMTRNSVSSLFRGNLPSVSDFRKTRMHSSIARSASSCALSSSSLKLSYSCVSSGKQWTCGRWRSIALNSEDVSITNSKGPRHEPWDTPQSGENCLESDPSMADSDSSDISWTSTGSPSSKYEHRRASALLRNIQNIRICVGKKPIVSVT